MEYIKLNGKNLSIEQVISVACKGGKVEIATESLEKVRQSREFIEEKVRQKELIYAINTGFGSNASELIEDNEEAKDLQKKLLLSHACGVGPNFSKELVKAIMLIRLNTLLAGYSGIREETLLLLKELINQNIYPVIPSQGSVGASGDLCPLSHMAIVLIGEGYAEIELEEGGKLLYKTLPAAEVLQIKGLKAIELKHKEGIALNNGTTVMAALGVFGVYEGLRLLKLGVLSSCLAFEALCARKQAFDAKIHQVRLHKGQIEIARLINEFTQNSDFIGLEAKDILAKIPTEIIAGLPDSSAKQEVEAMQKGKALKFSSKVFRHLPEEENLPRWKKWESVFKLAEKKITPQDAYSIRCTPQVLGASLQALRHIQETIENELNAVVDNPLIFIHQEDNQPDEVLSGGNFHGQPVALVLDYLKLALAEIGNLLERQINKLVDPANNDILPAFLVEKVGINSGWMIPQYVAAGLVSENKVLVHPASADSIPTSANQEDHVSMGTIAGRQALEILENVKQIVVILMLSAAQAVDLRKIQLAKAGLDCRLGTGTRQLYDEIRKNVSYMEEDRLLYEDIKKISNQFDNFLKLID